MIVAGLTGGIATGKSTVSAILESAGAIIIDADHIAREVVKRDNLPETDALARIRSQMPIEEKKRLASIVIDNTGIKDKTREATLNIYQYLKSKAQ